MAPKIVKIQKDFVNLSLLSRTLWTRKYPDGDVLVLRLAATRASATNEDYPTLDSEEVEVTGDDIPIVLAVLDAMAKRCQSPHPERTCPTPH